jgi:hypothetical protein
MAQIYPSRVLQKRTSTHHLRINTGVEQSLANSCSSQESASSYLYHYNPLRESTSIRIFQLEPGEEGVPLRCTIEHVDVNSGVKFSAVSYVVGSEKTSDRILVGADQYISLTASLHEVLQNLRGIENIEQKTFWADQICIDKHNTDERNQQVALMGTVYRKAAQVITYIGPETLNDRKGISLIQTINNLWEKIQHLHPDLDSTVVKSIVERHLPEENDSSWDGFGSIIFRAWSTRVWMIQENVVNENTIMVCGKIAFPLIIPPTELHDIFADHLPERLKFALHNLRATADSGTLRILPLPSFGRLIFLRAWMKENRFSSMKLLDLLRIGCNFECRDPRDKVYALLGLASKELEIEPDYNKSAASVLTDTTVRILQTSSNLDVLNHVSNDRRDTKLPSWVPDWSLPKSRFLLNTTFALNPELEHCAAANTTSTVNFDAHQAVLTLHGAIIDSIRCSAGDPTINASHIAQEPDLILTEYPRMMQVLGNICREFNYPSNPLPAELLYPLSRTLTADRRGVPGGDVNAWFTAYLKLCRFRYEMAAGRLLPGQRDISTQADGSKFLKYSLISEGKSLCVTTSGRICLTPSETRVGDSVAILYGGRTPYVLRPVGEDFEFVGESYVHGLMKGEALKDPNFQSTVRKIRLI